MIGGHFSATLVDNVDWLDGRDWLMRRGFRYYLTADEGPDAEFVDVPARFRTNFASTPRIVWALFPPTDPEYAQIAGVHDKLFLAPVIRTAYSARPCRFEETPRIFVDGAEALGAGWVKRRVMYRMLQAFSRGPWDQYRLADRVAIAAATPRQLVTYEAITVAARVLHG